MPNNLDRIDIAIQNAKSTAQTNVVNLNKALATLEKLRKIGRADPRLETQVRQQLAQQKGVLETL